MNPIADILGASGLHVFAEIALVLFLIAFGTIVTQLLTARRSSIDYAANLPLQDDDVPVHPSSERES
jgi:cbb3-type cytochrome oxidase subunit 3